MAALAAFALFQAVVGWAAPASPAFCQPLSSLSFRYPPVVDPCLKANVIYQNLTAPRGMRFDAEQNLLVVERLVGVSALTFRNDSGCVGWEKRVVIADKRLEHGIEIGPGHDGHQYLYASSMENVFRWEYSAKNASIIGPPTTLVWNMTNVGVTFNDHVTRTLLLEPPVEGVSKYLIVSRGSAGNADDAAANVTTGTAQIRRFALKNITSVTGTKWSEGKVLGWGLRNGVAIALSRDTNSVWEAENSSDQIHWRGVDVHQDNPAEELNRIPIRGAEYTPDARKYYGYPSCFTAWDSSTVPQNATSPQFNFKTGAQFSVRDPQTSPTDEWCANPKNNVRPVLPLGAHTAPLDIVFSGRSRRIQGSDKEGLPKAWNGDAFVSLHGSWNRDNPTGYSLIRIPWSKREDRPVADPGSKTGYEAIVRAADLSKCPDGCTRPVGVVFDERGRMIVTSDSTGEVFMVQSATA